MLRSRTIKPDAVHEFKTFGHAILPYGNKPSPSFDRNKIIKEEWFSNTDVERKKSERVQCFMMKFSTTHCGNPNFRIWSMYMDIELSELRGIVTELCI